MTRFPVVKPREAIKAFKKIGFVVDRVSGSHYILYKSSGRIRVSIPFHNRPIKRKTLKGIIKDAEITVEEFRKLL